MAAYFADALRSGDNRYHRLPGAPVAFAELAGRARALSDTTRDRAVDELAEAIERADRRRD